MISENLKNIFFEKKFFWKSFFFKNRNKIAKNRQINKCQQFQIDKTLRFLKLIGFFEFGPMLPIANWQNISKPFPKKFFFEKVLFWTLFLISDWLYTH